MWAGIFDKFECCFKPENNNIINNIQSNKEVVLDNLDDKKKVKLK